MEKIRKMDERELLMSLKVSRICYVSLSLTILVCFLLAIFNVFAGKESIYLSIIMIVDAITFSIAKVIYNPNKKIENEK